MFESWAMPGSIGQLAFGRRLLAVDVHCCNGVGCVHDGEVGLDPVRLVGVLPLSHVRINVDASGLSLRLLAWMRVVGASYAQRRGDSHSPRVRVRSFEDGEVASNMPVWYLPRKVVRDGRRSRCAGRHPSGAPGHSWSVAAQS